MKSSDLEKAQRIKERINELDNFFDNSMRCWNKTWLTKVSRKLFQLKTQHGQKSDEIFCGERLSIRIQREILNEITLLREELEQLGVSIND
ncbi:hypothetical protein [Streptococcus suis]|uniref:hypothetical protein n=1 Tax=Streptococcus suis TaxID=1307 RepID=UPI000492DE31|nr:hypothetical protein [Streptococcus suis]MDG4523836.1 hypothetical protein [Streptococcus suis]QTA57580.1 hypothetical protein J1N58_03870 [Streptococcus suis]HEL1969876.1 hypothetical protein [Streptococcus suis]